MRFTSASSPTPILAKMAMSVVMRTSLRTSGGKVAIAAANSAVSSAEGPTAASAWRSHQSYSRILGRSNMKNIMSHQYFEWFNLGKAQKLMWPWLLNVCSRIISQPWGVWLTEKSSKAMRAMFCLKKYWFSSERMTWIFRQAKWTYCSLRCKPFCTPALSLPLMILDDLGLNVRGKRLYKCGINRILVWILICPWICSLLSFLCPCTHQINLKFHHSNYHIIQSLR